MILIKYSGLLSIVCFGVFAMNTAIGKYYVSTGQGTSPPIDGVPEFFLLAIATGFLAIWLLKKETNNA